jgi:hypothetical protein
MEFNNGTLLGLGMSVLGGVLLGLGLRQRHRVAFDQVPLTSWHFKLFAGGGLLIIGVNVLFHALTGK